jgi:hypothetical protein
MTSSELKVLAAKVTSQHKTFKRGLSNQTVEEVVSALLLSASQADKIAELEKELSSVVAGLFSEDELAILKLENQAKGVKDFVFSIEGFGEGYIQALKEGK